jgi:hypothetical protein
MCDLRGPVIAGPCMFTEVFLLQDGWNWLWLSLPTFYLFFQHVVPPTELLQKCLLFIFNMKTCWILCDCFFASQLCCEFYDNLFSLFDNLLYQSCFYST